MIKYFHAFLVLLFLFSTTCYSQPVDLVVQTGHSGDVNAVAYSRNSKYIASACGDGSIKVWDAKSGFEIYTVYGFPESASHVTFSPDSKHLLGTGSNMNVFYEVETGKKIATVSSDEEQEDFEDWYEYSLAIISHDNKYCFSASNVILRWETAEFFHPERYDYKYKQIPYGEDSVLNLSPPASAFFYRGHTGPVTGLSVSPDNKFLISIAGDSTLRIWDIVSGKEIRRIRHAPGFNGLAITKDGKKIITADKSMEKGSGLRSWDFSTGKQLSLVPYTRGYANAVSISPDNNWLVAGTLLRDLILYRLPDLRQVSVLQGHTDWISSIGFSGDSRFFVSGGADDAVKIWEPLTGKLVRDFRKTIANIDNLVYEKDHRLITTTSSSSSQQKTFTWEIDNGIGIKNRYLTKPHFGNTEFLSIDRAGKNLLLTEDTVINFFDPVNGKLLKRVVVPKMGTAALSPNGDYVLFQDHASDTLYKLGRDKSKAEFFAPFPDNDTAIIFKNIDQLDFSPDGGMIAGGGGADIFIWDSTGKYLRNMNYLDIDSTERKEGNYHESEYLALPNAQINDLKFSPDGKLIAAACRMPDPVATGGIIIIWEVESGKMLHWYAGHNYIIQSINWSPDGKFLITGSNDTWMKVWRYDDFTSREPTPVFEFDDDFTPTHSSFTADNKWIIRGGIDGKIIIRDAKTYKTIATLIGLDEDDYVAVTDDQYYAASKKGIRLIAFRQHNKIYPAEQFDIKYNRPDKVLEALGSSDTGLIRSYRQAWNKRMKKLGIDTSYFRLDFAAPDFDFADRDSIQYRQGKEQLRLRIKGADTLFQLDRFNVWINEVPLYGQKGIPLLNANKFDTIITIQLSYGENKIETSAINRNGTESYRVPIMVNYQPIRPVAPVIHFVGIGIDQFEDSQYNLEYSTKDIRDLCTRLKLKFGSSIRIDTLFNRSVTRENIRNLKKRLLKTGIHDKVIISYSGHGLLNKDFDYFLSTYAVNFEKPEENGLAYEELENLLDNIPARQKLLLIDACHSGEVDKEELVAINIASDSLKLVKGLKPVGYKTDTNLGLKNSFELMQNLFVNVGKSTGAQIISAAAGNQFALERNDLKNGVFTYTILEAMQKNKTMKLSVLRKYVAQRVSELTRGMQQPTSRNETIASDWEIW